MATFVISEDKLLSMAATPGFSGFGAQWKEHQIKTKLFQDVCDAKEALEPFVNVDSEIDEMRASVKEKEEFFLTLETEDKDLSEKYSGLRKSLVKRSNILFEMGTISGDDGNTVNTLKQKGLDLAWTDYTSAVEAFRNNAELKREQIVLERLQPSTISRSSSITFSPC